MSLFPACLCGRPVSDGRISCEYCREKGLEPEHIGYLLGPTVLDRLHSLDPRVYEGEKAAVEFTNVLREAREQIYAATVRPESDIGDNDD